MLAAVLPLAARHDVFVATAAVADWRPASEAVAKIKKDGSAAVPALGFVENPDILATVAALPAAERPFCVGFAAETEDLERHARAKLVKKRVDLVVANLGPATFGRDDNSLCIVSPEGSRELPRAPKAHRLNKIMKRVQRSKKNLDQIQMRPD
jgi:phosphopantothenoylcysteine decarboxylase/phosphopantothenate--cysteine ligase